jgi:hypothetical protein
MPGLRPIESLLLQFAVTLLIILAYFGRLYLLYLSFLVNTAVISRWKSSGKFLKTTKYLIKLDTVWVIITAVMIDFFKGYLRGFRRQK